MDLNACCHLSLVFVAAFSSCLIGLNAEAETGPDKLQKHSQIETVVVTARRVEENIQEIPLSVSVLGSSQLKDLVIEDLSDLSGNTPSLNIDFSAPISGASNAATIYMRGIGQPDFLLTNDPAVGVYLDDVYIARSVGAVLSLADVERVEVLRGPQGVFFGRNTIGGAINVVTKKPSGIFGGDIRLKVGEDGRRDVAISMDIPILEESLSARVSFNRERRDGYIERPLAGDSLGSRSRDGLFLKVYWEPNDQFKIDFMSDYVSIDENSAAGNSVWLGDPAQFGRGIITDLYNLIAAPVVDLSGFGTNTLFDDRFIPPKPYVSQGTGPNTTDIQLIGHTIQAAFDLRGLQIKSVSSYRDMDARFSRDADASPITLAETRSLYDQFQFSQEIQFFNSSEGERFDWLLGVYYFEERGNNLEAADIAPALFEVTSNPMLALSLLGDIGVRNTSKAVFGHAKIALSPSINVGIGVRYTQETKRADVQFFAADIELPLIGDPEGELSYRDFSPHVSAQYQFADDQLIYCSVSKGFKSGGFTGRYVTPTANLQPFGQESLVAYEAGVKAMFFDKKFQANVSGFYSDYDDIQILVFDGLAPQTRNAGEGKIKGLELEVLWHLAPKLQLMAHVSYIDAKYTSLDTNVVEELFDALQLQDKFVNTPDWSFGASLDYKASLSERISAKLVASVDYQSDIANDAINTPELIQKSRAVINARFAVEHNSGVEISAYGRNITDEVIIVSGAADIPTFGGVEAIYAPPRELGVELSYFF